MPTPGSRSITAKCTRTSIKRFAASPSRTGRQPVVVSLVKVKKDLIEFQLGGGGFGTFGDDTSTSANIPLIEKSSDRERELEKRIKDEDDRDRRHRLEGELDDLRDHRERENRRIMAERGPDRQRPSGSASPTSGTAAGRLPASTSATRIGSRAGMRPEDVGARRLRGFRPPAEATSTSCERPSRPRRYPRLCFRPLVRCQLDGQEGAAPGPNWSVFSARPVRARPNAATGVDLLGYNFGL